MSEKHLGPAGDPAEGSRKAADQNLTQQAEKLSDAKPTPKTPKENEGDTEGGKHPPVKSETGA